MPSFPFRPGLPTFRRQPFPPVFISSNVSCLCPQNLLPSARAPFSPTRFLYPRDCTACHRLPHFLSTRISPDILSKQNPTGFPAPGHRQLHPAESRSFERGDFFNMSTATLMSECAIEFRCCRHELMFCRISLTSLHGGVMNSTIHRHDISDHVWSILEPLLPGRKESWGGKARDNRLFINAVFRILRTGAPCELFRRSTATGKILIAVFVVGVTMEYGKKSCLI